MDDIKVPEYPYKHDERAYRELRDLLNDDLSHIPQTIRLSVAVCVRIARVADEVDAEMAFSKWADVLNADLILTLLKRHEVVQFDQRNHILNLSADVITRSAAKIRRVISQLDLGQYIKRPDSEWDQILPIVERRLHQDSQVALIAKAGMEHAFRNLELTIDILRRRYPQSGVFSEVAVCMGDPSGGSRYTVGLITSDGSAQNARIFGSWSIEELDIALSQCMVQLERWLTRAIA